MHPAHQLRQRLTIWKLRFPAVSKAFKVRSQYICTVVRLTRAVKVHQYTVSTYRTNEKLEVPKLHDVNLACVFH